MPNPKKKRKKKPENPVLKVAKDISDDATKIIKKGIKDISKTIDNTIKNIQSDFEKEKLKILKRDPAIKKIQKETIRKTDKKAKKKIKKVRLIAKQAQKDADKTRMDAEKTRRENIDLKEKLNDVESQNKKIKILFNELNEEFSEVKKDISKIKDGNLYLVVLILEFEKRIREFIKVELRNHYGENWWDDGIPSSIQKGVDGRIRRNNLENTIDRTKFLCYSDYPPIILDINNWKKIFYRKFPHKDYFESRMEIITNYRNFLFHGNEINQDIEKLKSPLKDLNQRINLT